MSPFNSSIRRSVAAALLVLATLLTGLTACSSGGSTTGDTFTLRIGFIGTRPILTGSLGYLQSKGELVAALAPAGVNQIKTYQFANGPDLNQALASGDLDVGNYGDTPAIVGYAAGLKTGLLSQTQVGLDAEIVTKKGGPQSLAALEGQTVAVAKGSYMHRYLLGAVEDAGIKINLLNIALADTPAALARGDIAAAAVPIANGELLRSQGYPVIDELAKDHRKYRGTSVAVATESFLGQHKNFVPVWQAAQASSVKQVKADWTGYLAFLHTTTAIPAAIVDQTTGPDQLIASPFNADGLALLAGTQKFLVDNQLAARSFSINEWIAPGAKT